MSAIIDTTAGRIQAVKQELTKRMEKFQDNARINALDYARTMSITPLITDAHDDLVRADILETVIKDLDAMAGLNRI